MLLFWLQAHAFLKWWFACLGHQRLCCTISKYSWLSQNCWTNIILWLY